MAKVDRFFEDLYSVGENGRLQIGKYEFWASIESSDCYVKFPDKDGVIVEYSFPDYDNLLEWIEDQEGELAICEKCSQVMVSGYTDDYGSFYCSEKCVDEDMSFIYGKGYFRKATKRELEEDPTCYYYTRLSLADEWEGFQLVPFNFEECEE